LLCDYVARLIWWHWSDAEHWRSRPDARFAHLRQRRRRTFNENSNKRWRGNNNNNNLSNNGNKSKSKSIIKKYVRRDLVNIFFIKKSVIAHIFLIYVQALGNFTYKWYFCKTTWVKAIFYIAIFYIIVNFLVISFD